MINDYHNRGKKSRDGVDFLSQPLGPLITTAKYAPNGQFTILNKLPKGVDGFIQVKGSVPEEAKDQIESLIQPPSDKVNVILNTAEQEMVDNLNTSVNKQLIQQFYEAYYSPTGLEDSNFRLGKVQSTITDVHALYKDGVEGLIAATPDAAWRTNLNYSFKVDEGLGNASYNFRSLAFPPFISTKADVKYNQVTAGPANANVNTYIVDQTFDMTNLLYKKNSATVRLPGFKAVNDNINMLQFLMNRAFGIESTYINEWDLSMYMQEGIVTIWKKPTDPTEPLATKEEPQYVTTLTYGLGTDAPVEKNIQNPGAEAVDMDILEIAPFASWNLAVSTRRAVDNITLNFPANTMSYEIAKYPFSSYWVAPENGRLLADHPYQKYYEGVNNPKAYRIDPDTGDKIYYPHWETIHTDMDVPQYVDDLTAYRAGKGIWLCRSEAYASLQRIPLYCPNYVHGPDLSHSSVPFEYVLKHADARDAILSGWHAMDEAGKKYCGDYEVLNGYQGPNSYSFLPFWKQFFFNEGDGMEDIDQYWQEVQGADDAEKSILEAIDDIWQMVNANSDGFNSFMPEEEANPVKSKKKNRARSQTSPLTANYSYGDGDDDDYGNIKFSVPIVGTIEVPKTKLLNMFVNRHLRKDKANQKERETKTKFVSDTFKQVGDLPKSTKPTGNSNAPATTTPNNPTTESAEDRLKASKNVETYTIEETEDKTSYSYADGVNNHSPMMYGGPHGEWYSPLTLEGVTEMGNEALEIVPTMDINDLYNYRRSVTADGSVAEGSIDSKNFKFGRYLASRITLGMSERNAAYNLMQKDIDPDIIMPFEGSYNSQHMTSREACLCLRFCVGWGRWKHCWSWHIPTRFIFAEARSSWSWPFLRHWGKWENRYWYNYWRNNYVHVDKTVKLSEIQRDFADEIYALVPQYRGYRLNTPNQQPLWHWGNGQRDWADEDTNGYNSHSGHNEQSVGVDHNYCSDYTGKMRYLVGEISNHGRGSTPEGFDSVYGPMCEYAFEGAWHAPSSTRNQRHFSGSWWHSWWNHFGWNWGWGDPTDSRIVACYSREDSEFDIVKRNMFAYVPGNGRSSGLFTVSLPIVNKGNLTTIDNKHACTADVMNNMLELVTIAANVERDVMLRPYWIWTLKWHWGSWLWGHTCHHWWRSCHFCGWHHAWYLYPCWHLVRYIIPRQTYSLYVYPEKTKNIIPGKAFIRSMWYTDWLNNLSRNKTSNNIIDRYKISDWANIDVTNYWPFSNSFRINHGKPGFWQKPGYSNGYDSYAHVVTTRGIYFGDVIQGYINRGYVATRVGDGFRYLYTPHAVSWNRYVHDWDLGFYLYLANTSENTIHQMAKHDSTPLWNPRLRSRYYIASNTGLDYDEPLTCFIRDMVYSPPALQYFKGADRAYALFNQNDVFDVLIDTCKVQYQWLEQICKYAAAYLTDENIYKLYLGSVDKKIRDIITLASMTEATASENNAASKTYFTGSYTEDINYYDALMIVEKAFKNAPPGQNSILTLTQDRMVDILQIKNKVEELKQRWTDCYNRGNRYYLNELRTSFRDLPITSAARGWDILEDLSKLITNTKLLLDNMNGVKSEFYNADGSVKILEEQHATIARPDGKVRIGVTFDLINNPTTLFWAYVNVLYQARKFYINRRLDKVQGSYWILRSLERVMTFQDAARSASTAKQLPIVTDDGPGSQNKKMDIKFIQGCMTMEELSKKTEFDLSVNYTNAVWVKVKYISHPNPMESSEWDSEKSLYKGKEIVYVPESRKYAYKPADGYYYIMSQAITERTKALIAEYSEVSNSINLDAFEISDKLMTKANVGGKITTDEVRAHLERLKTETIPDEAKDEWDENGVESDSAWNKRVDECSSVLVGIALRDFVEHIHYYIYGITKSQADAETLFYQQEDEYKALGKTLRDVVPEQEDPTKDIATWLPLLTAIYKTRLASYYKEAYETEINKLLYKLYIVWEPACVGSALHKSDVSPFGQGTTKHYIDPFQAQETASGKRSLQLTDAYGTVHTTDEGQEIRSGITFGVADTLNIGTIIDNVPTMKVMTPTEMLCNTITDADYWRIEIPKVLRNGKNEVELRIPTDLLKNKPVLVSDYDYELMKKEYSGQAIPTTMSALVGLSNNALSPISEFDIDKLTAASVFAVGESPSFQTLGLSDTRMENAEKHFG